jgi:hypothetical protein
LDAIVEYDVVSIDWTCEIRHNDIVVGVEVENLHLLQMSAVDLIRLCRTVRTDVVQLRISEFGGSYGTSYLWGNAQWQCLCCTEAPASRICSVCDVGTLLIVHMKIILYACTLNCTCSNGAN